MQHRNLKFSQSDNASAVWYAVFFFLMLSVAFFPFYKFNSTFVDTSGRISILDMAKDMGEPYACLFMLPVLPMLISLVISTCRERVSLYSGFCWSVVNLYLTSFLFMMSIACSLEMRRMVAEVYAPWCVADLSVGFALLSAIAIFWFVFSLGEVIDFYKWYPVQTLVWLLAVVVLTILQLLLAIPLIIIFRNLFIAWVWGIPFLLWVVILILCMCKARIWNKKIRRRIAKKRQSSLYLDDDDKADPDINIYDNDASEKEHDVETVNQILPTGEESTTVDVPVEETSLSGRKKSRVTGLWIIIGMIVLAGIGMFFFRLKSQETGSRYFVYTQSAVIYGAVDGYNGSDPQGKLMYGDSVMAFTMDPTESWIKVSARKEDKTLTGYADITKLMDKEMFEVLRSRGGFENENIRLAIYENYERKALAQKLGELGHDWKLHIVNDKYGNTPMIQSGYIDGLSPKGLGFAFVAINSLTGEKHFYLYSYDDDSNPVPVYDEPVNKKYDGISDISIIRNKVKVKYYVYDTDNMADQQESPVDAGSIVFKGLVDGKYPVTMKLNISDRVVTGSYHYDKYNVPLSLNGEMETYPTGTRYLTLTEMSGGVVTGQFIGSWEDGVYSGSWINDDGGKEMHFELFEDY